MTIRRPLVVSATAGASQLLSTDIITGAGDIYSGATRYEAGQLRSYWFTGTTDSNGRITCFPTTTGLVGGTALFSAVSGASAIMQISNGTAAANGFFVLESISADKKTVIFRALIGTTAFLTIGLNYSSAAFGGSGLTGILNLVGLP